MDPYTRARLAELTHGVAGCLYDALVSDRIRAYHVIQIDGEIVAWAGMGMLSSEGIFFLGAFVDPRYRGQGLGKRAVSGLARKIPTHYATFKDEIGFAAGCETLYQPVIDAGFNAFVSNAFLPAMRVNSEKAKFLDTLADYV